MAESILVTGKKISSMELVTNVTGNEKIPTGQPDDLALTPNQIADHTIARGDLASQEDLSQVEVSLGTQITDLESDVTSNNNSIRGLIAAEEAARIAADNSIQTSLDGEVSARIAADNSIQTSLDGEVSARIAADNLKVDKEGSVVSVAGRVGDVVLAPSDVLVGGFGSQEDVNKYIPKPFLSGYTYGLGERVVLENGDIVKNIVAGNTADPNVDMTGWVNPELDQKIRNGQILNLVTDFGAVGGTDCTDQIRAAIESAIQTGLPLYIPATTLPYLYRVALMIFTFDNLSANKSLTIFGDGEGSCFKCMDGQIVQRWGQSFRFAPSQDVDSIYIKNIKIDNNARGSAPPPSDSPYAFEQTATIATAPISGVTIKNVTYENVVIVDPSADGFNDSGSGKIETLRYINIIERDRTRVRASILMAHTAKKLVIINPIVSVIESEPTNAPTNGSATIQIINGQAKILDLSQKSETDVVNYYISGLIVSDFCNLGTLTNLVIDGGVLRVSTGRNNFPYLRRAVFRNLKLKFPYNPDTGAVVGLNFLRRTGESQKSYVEFDNVDFEIDYAGDLPIPTTDYLIGNTSGSAMSAASAPNHLLTIKNSRFDSRAAHSLSAYRIGTVDLINNNYGGTNAAIVWGTSNNSYATIMKVVGGDFSAVTGASLSFTGAVGSASSLTLSGDWFGLNASKYVLQNGNISTFGSFVKNTRYIVAAALPTVALAKDVFKVGVVADTVGTVVEYQCTASSTTTPTFICSKQLGMYEAETASLPLLTSKEKWARAYDTTTNTIKTWTGSAWI